MYVFLVGRTIGSEANLSGLLKQRRQRRVEFTGKKKIWSDRLFKENNILNSTFLYSVASGFASSHHGHPEVERSISFDHDADARRRRQSRGSSSSDLVSSSGGHTTSASNRHSTQPSPRYAKCAHFKMRTQYLY